MFSVALMSIRSMYLKLRRSIKTPIVKFQFVSQIIIHRFVCKHGADSPEDSGYCQLPSIPRDKCTLTAKITDCFCTVALYGSILQCYHKKKSTKPIGLVLFFSSFASDSEPRELLQRINSPQCALYFFIFSLKLHAHTRVQSPSATKEIISHSPMGEYFT